MACSNAFSCWLEAHPELALFLVIVSSLILLMLLGWICWLIYRGLSMAVKEDREQQQLHQEERAVLVRAWKAIRMGEEWEVDVSELRQEVSSLVLLRKIKRVLERAQFRIVLACTLFFFVTILCYLTAQFLQDLGWLLIVLGVLVILSIALIAWQVLRYWRLNSRLRPMVEQLSTQQEASGEE